MPVRTIHSTDQQERQVTMTKKNWTVTTPGYEPFPMILLECALDHTGALAFARSIWPRCTVE
ncbi:hypothetical protein ALO95_100866 [Pseudomonas syringae pv. antirrhini]|uniref:Uncharacterized protein n=1 Tax=Pseudomonas syringae pv. antirrhini TaxID=251702 RepID=A0A0P9JQE2_9PSED|nr:hypothetical protein ALO88_101021 [Pseudomonas syringae pv. antirrhini]RMP40296.1 hypothetical protein ALQ24_101099 [Pseudomonas syringae pv. antirrhini]RMP43365.1 hypothetical protein ALQ23_100948 [Pseudomonas syringae pv. antirrhini]RMW27306.1 hypothetical protein ALO95_100866 [Pseudomonas syringae pv. antirrhini]